MPKLVPVHPLFGEGGRAERTVWDVLRGQLPDEAVLFHSLRLQERQREYEADLVVLIPDVGWAPLVGAFLADLQQRRGNQVSTRNTRLAAIHSLFGYGALRYPEHAATIGRVLAIPAKRCERNLPDARDDGRSWSAK